MTLTDGWLMLVHRPAYDAFLAGVRSGDFASTGNIGSAPGTTAPPDVTGAGEIYAGFSGDPRDDSEDWLVRSVSLPTAWERDGIAKGFAGPVWYWNEFELGELANEAADATDAVDLCFEGVSYACAVYLNGELIATHRGIWDHFRVPVPHHVRGKNRLLVEVHKPGGVFPVRQSLAGFIPYVTTPFGGPWQPVHIERRPHFVIEGVALETAGTLAGNGSISAILRFVMQSTDASRSHGALRATVKLTELTLHTDDAAGLVVLAFRGPLGESDDPHDTEIAIHFTVQDARLWSPEAPHRYRVTVAVEDANGRSVAGQTAICALREISVAHDNPSCLTLNGVPIYPRGLLNWCAYPDTFSPAIAPDRIRREFLVARELGYNLIKLCLVIPGDDYFELADCEGMMLWVEIPMWLPEIDRGYRSRAVREYRSIVRRIRRHPSIVAWTLGCELDADANEEMLRELFAIVKKESGATLVRDNSGSAEAYGGADLDVSDYYDYHFYAEAQQFSPLLDHFYPKWRARKPLLFGEYCDSDTARSVAEIRREHGQASWWMLDDPIENPQGIRWDYTVVTNESRLAAWPYAISFADLRALSHLKSAAYRKDIVEQTRKRGDTSGYVITGFADTPISTAGMIDDLGAIKFDSGTFRSFNADTVLAVERRRRRIWRHGGDRPQYLDEHVVFGDEDLTVDLIVAHRGAAIGKAVVSWSFGVLQGQIDVDIAGDHLAKAGAIVVPAGTFGAEIQAIELTAQVDRESRLIADNRWSYWYAPRPDTDAWSFQLFDPDNCFQGLMSAAPGVVPATRESDVSASPGATVVATRWSEHVPEWISAGANVVLVVASAPFTRPMPFWRESVPFFHKHPLADWMPHSGFAGIEFKGVTPDFAIDSDLLAAAITVPQDVVRPVLTRYDARGAQLAHYLVVVPGASPDHRGTLAATTLRLGGGFAEQPGGIPANRLGTLLLDRALSFVARGG